MRFLAALLCGVAIGIGFCHWNHDETVKESMAAIVKANQGPFFQAYRLEVDFRARMMPGGSLELQGDQWMRGGPVPLHPSGRGT